MPAIAETFRWSSGRDRRIDRELKKLWSEGEGAMTRASLMNLAVYSEEPDSLTRNTQLLARITENHACRAIVIGADPQRERRSDGGVDQRALSHQSRRDANKFAPNKFHSCSKARRCRLLPKHCLFPARFRSPALSLVAVGILPSRWIRSFGHGSID